jgi:hypothetical protein
MHDVKVSVWQSGPTLHVAHRDQGLNGLALMWKPARRSQGAAPESRNTSQRTTVFDPRFRNRSDSFLLCQRMLSLEDLCLVTSAGDFVAAPMLLQRRFLIEVFRGRVPAQTHPRAIAEVAP